MPGDLYLGLIPEINQTDPEEEDDILALVQVDSSSGSDEDEDGPNGSQPNATHAATPDLPTGPGAGGSHPHPSAAAAAAAALNNPDEPSWLETIRCHDSTAQPQPFFPSSESPDFIPTHESISFDGSSRILYVGSFMDNTRIIVVRSSDEGYVEVFTTDSVHRRNWEALHSIKPVETLNGTKADLAEGDYQILSYQVSGQAWAASVDDLSGKIVLVVQEDGRYFIVVLDYGFPSTTERSGDKVVPVSGTESHSGVGRRASSDTSQDEDAKPAPRHDKGKGRELNSPRQAPTAGPSQSRKGKGKARQLPESLEVTGHESDDEDHGIDAIDGDFVQTELEVEAGFRAGSSSGGASRTVLTISDYPPLPRMSGSYLGHSRAYGDQTLQESPSEHRLQ